MDESSACSMRGTTKICFTSLLSLPSHLKKKKHLLDTLFPPQSAGLTALCVHLSLPQFGFQHVWGPASSFQHRDDLIVSTWSSIAIAGHHTSHVVTTSVRTWCTMKETRCPTWTLLSTWRQVRSGRMAAIAKVVWAPRSKSASVRHSGADGHESPTPAHQLGFESAWHTFG